jgi:two-component system OmpR family response regulator
MNGKHVLIVEDDCLSNLALCEFLQENGYRVEPAYCAEAALASIRRRPPCALLTDLDLGAGATGFDVARFARSRDATMPVVYMSGQAAGRFPRDAVEGSQFVAKPYRGEQILAAIGAQRPPAPPSGPFLPAGALRAQSRGAVVIGGLVPIWPLKAIPARPVTDWAPLAHRTAAPGAQRRMAG